jgi:hypothetical protein
MKISLDIPENKAYSLMDIPKNISSVRAKPLTNATALLIEEFKEAIDELQLIKAGKKEARDLEVFLNGV